MRSTSGQAVPFEGSAMKTRSYSDTGDPINFNDEVQVRHRRIPARFSIGRVACQLEQATLQHDRCLNRSCWVSYLDLYHFIRAASGRHLPPAFEPLTKKPMPRSYGPIIVRVDAKHKTLSKTLQPRFLHVEAEFLTRISKAPPPPPVSATEIAQVLLTDESLAREVFRLLSSTLTVDENNLSLDSTDLVKHLRDHQLADEVFWLMEHPAVLQSGRLGSISLQHA